MWIRDSEISAPILDIHMILVTSKCQLLMTKRLSSLLSLSSHNFQKPLKEHLESIQKFANDIPSEQLINILHNTVGARNTSSCLKGTENHP